MIVYFSATGNSKFVAQRIAESIGSTAVSIFDLPATGDISISGIVTPTYAWGIPSVIEDFLKSRKITKNGDYLFYVATYGTTSGQSGYFANRALRKNSGLCFNAYFDVKMPDTWTPIFDLSDQDKVRKINEKVDAQIEENTRHILEQAQGNFMKSRLPAVTRIVYRPYYNQMRRTKHFSVEDSCIACGLCEKKCPVNAIEMKDGKPTWKFEQCTICLGCLHRCPKFAIQYGKNTKKHGQYLNPNVKI